MIIFVAITLSKTKEESTLFQHRPLDRETYDHHYQTVQLLVLSEHWHSSTAARHFLPNLISKLSHPALDTHAVGTVACLLQSGMFLRHLRSCCKSNEFIFNIKIIGRKSFF